MKKRIPSLKKMAISILFIIGGIFIVVLFWQKPIFLIFLIISLSAIKHKIFPIKFESKIYFISALLGSFAEGIMMTSGAWAYTKTHIFNIPIWLPFMWGLAGILFSSIYLSLKR